MYRYSEKMKSSAKQRQQIAILRKRLNIEDDVYRDEMLGYYGVNSSKDLTARQAGELLFKLITLAKEAGVYQSKKKYNFQKYKYNNLAGRENKMATPAQLRMIEAMWFRVSIYNDDEARAGALKKFSKKITEKENLRFLTKSDITTLKTAIERMEVIR